jgi:D-beta-D-heptose 7-phosphate kinase / D-beta-D-heptose 1-phosphate adenosyltransferase
LTRQDSKEAVVATKIFPIEDLARLLKEKREGDLRIVFTNGCFDILHYGHVCYLQEARSLGDILVVGLNTDESVHRLKGDNRPINCASERAGVLAALGCIDYVTFFSEPTPIEAIELLKPDVHVKGGDYVASTLPEYNTVRAYGGHVAILPYVEGCSTRRIIQRICEAYK